MSLFDHLMESRTKQELAKLAVATAKEKRRTARSSRGA